MDNFLTNAIGNPKIGMFTIKWAPKKTLQPAVPTLAWFYPSSFNTAQPFGIGGQNRVLRLGKIFRGGRDTFHGEKDLQKVTIKHI